MKEPNSTNYKKIINSLRWNDKGLIPVVTQSEKDNQVLMLAWVNQKALKISINTNLATYYSRSRQKIWVKGEQSGNYQKIKQISLDCDLDSVLFLVEQVNDTACHTLRKSCFFYKLSKDKKTFTITSELKNEVPNMNKDKNILTQLDKVIQKNRSLSLDSSYVAKMKSLGIDKMLKKINEEASEFILASKNNDQKNLIDEAADLWFHSLLVLHHHQLDSTDILKELNCRFGISGIIEKNSRRQKEEKDG